MRYTVRENIFRAISLSIFAILMIPLIWLLNDILSHLADWSIPFLVIVIALILFVVLLVYVIIYLWEE
ncbi:hypothetical protein DRN52_05255 [Thermococci archaeon]|nr:MAG: hypothetical protein DRN52_05255 [Thermococci archaeon]